MLDNALASPETKVGHVTYKSEEKHFQFGYDDFYLYYDYYYIDPGDYKLAEDILPTARDAGNDKYYTPYLIFLSGNSSLNLNDHNIGVGLMATNKRITIVPKEESSTETETADEKKEETKNPKTYDSIITYVSFMFISLFALVNVYKFNKNN